LFRNLDYANKKNLEKETEQKRKKL